YRSLPLWHLHAFPTRRSSDLQRLSGTVAPAGNKNAALPLLAATMLTDSAIILHNLPQIGDVATKVELLQKLGACIQAQGAHSWRSEEHTSELQSRGHLVCRLL